jgi:outer membrane protein assembly factor BamB
MVLCLLLASADEGNLTQQSKTAKPNEKNCKTYAANMARTRFYKGELGDSEVIKLVVFIVADFNNLYAINAENGAVLWKITTGAETGSVCPSNGIVYCGSGIQRDSEDKSICALDSITGKMLWRAQCDDGVREEIVAAGESVFVACFSAIGTLYNFEAKTGKLIWKSKIHDGLLSPPTVIGEYVYTDGACLNASDGKIVWHMSERLGLFIGAPVTLSDSTIGVGSMRGSFYAIEADSGRTKWEQTGKGRIYNTPASQDGVVYIDRHGVIEKTGLALSAKDGAVIWKVELGSTDDEQMKPGSGPVIGEESVYFISHSGSLVSIRKGDGKVKWKKSLASGPLAASVSIANNLLYCGTVNGSVHCLTAKDGSELWKVKLEGKISSSPSIASGR